MAMVERQGSQGSSIHSERIPAVVAVDRAQANANAIANANAQLEPVDLDVAAEHEERVRQSLELLRKKVTEFMASAPRGKSGTLALQLLSHSLCRSFAMICFISTCYWYYMRHCGALRS